MRRRRRREPLFKLLNELAVLLRLLNFSEMVQVGMREQFRGQRTVRPQEEEGELLEPRLALRREKARPPVIAGKILPRERKLFEIILQQKPCAL
jgi:hypothetical protein